MSQENVGDRAGHDLAREKWPTFVDALKDGPPACPSTPNRRAVLDSGPIWASRQDSGVETASGSPDTAEAPPPSPCR